MSQSERMDMPSVLIFDYKDTPGFYLAQDGAHEARWRPMPYSDIDIALEDFDESVYALITGLGTGRSIERLINLSDEFRIPRGIIAANTTSAKKYVREQFGDCIFSDYDIRTRDKVKSWLTAISLKQAAS